GVEGDGKETRVVVWSPSAQPQLKRGQRVRITNVRARRSSGGDFEVHGDAGSTIEVAKAEKVQLRVGAVLADRPTKLFLGVGKDKAVRLVELGPQVQEPAQGSLVGVVPDETSPTRLFCRTPGSVNAEAEDSFPEMEALVTKLKEVTGEDSQMVVEVIALSHGSADEVRLKDGTTVKKGELVVGDDTGELKLVAWRELSERLSGLQPGERLRVVGAVAKTTKMGGWSLQLSSFTVIERLRGPV
ncbi:MAG TPA: hypothetical protein VEB67_02775, partial [Nitrososphaerales archaeon]|nr:hypothetical protein [Nitrososphaerales archaeon]